MSGVLIVNKLGKIDFITKKAERCKAKTKTNQRCKSYAALDGFCMAHFKMQNNWKNEQRIDRDDLRDRRILW